MTGKWERVRLGDVALINPSKKDMPKISKYESVGFLSMDAVSNSGEINRIDTRILSDVLKGFTYFEDGDILFAKITPCMENGKGAIVSNMPNKVGFGSTEFHVVRPVHEYMDTDYLNYFMKNPALREEASKNMTGSAGQKRVPSTYLNNVKIPLPPLDEQKRIADVLDKASELIKKRKEQIRLMDELAKSLFIEMFGDPVENPMGWGLCKFSEMGEIKRGLSKHRPRDDPILLGGIYPLIQTGNVANSGLYIEKYWQTYSEIGLKQSKLWEKGTLCITIAANIAKTAILSFDSCFPDSIVGFLPNNKTNNIFIHYWFSFFQEILERQAPESAQKNINLKILNELKIIKPSISLQNEFADRITVIEQQKALLQDGLAKMETAYKALMQEYFG